MKTKNLKTENHRVGFKGDDVDKSAALCEHYLLSVPELLRYLVRLEYKRIMEAQDGRAKEA